MRRHPTPQGLAPFQRSWSWSVTEIAFNGWSESDQKAIREQLDRILNSGPFHQAQRRQRFLEYIVNEALAGRGERLKGYNVALAVFDRAETFDPNIDPIVRNGSRARARQASRILRGRGPRRSHSHRATKGHLHAAHRVQTGGNFRCFAGWAGRPPCGNPRSVPNLAKAPFAVVDDQASTAPPRTRIARTTAWMRFFAPSFLIALSMCHSTVRGDRFRKLPISAADRPSDTKSRTSLSLAQHGGWWGWFGNSRCLLKDGGSRRDRLPGC